MTTPRIEEMGEENVKISRDGKYVSINGVIYVCQDGELSPLDETIEALQDNK